MELAHGFDVVIQKMEGKMLFVSETKKISLVPLMVVEQILVMDPMEVVLMV